MWMWSRPLSLLRAPLRHSFIPKAQLSEKPAEHVLSAGEQVVGLVAMFVVMFVPSGWFLANVENYKKSS